MDELKRKREALVTRSFYLTFETLAIFGLPAILSVYLGSWLAETTGAGQVVVYVCLAIAFVLSWILFLYRVRQVSRSIKAIQTEIKEAEAAARSGDHSS